MVQNAISMLAVPMLAVPVCVRSVAPVGPPADLPQIHAAKNKTSCGGAFRKARHVRIPSVRVASFRAAAGRARNP